MTVEYWICVYNNHILTCEWAATFNLASTSMNGPENMWQLTCPQVCSLYGVWLIVMELSDDQLLFLWLFCLQMWRWWWMFLLLLSSGVTLSLISAHDHNLTIAAAFFLWHHQAEPLPAALLQSGSRTHRSYTFREQEKLSKPDWLF